MSKKDGEKKIKQEKEVTENNIVKERRVTSIVLLLAFLLVFIIGLFVWNTRYLENSKKSENNNDNNKVIIDKDVKLTFLNYDYDTKFEKNTEWIYEFDNYLVIGTYGKLYEILDINGQALTRFDEPMEYTNLYEKDNLLYIENIVYNDAWTETLLSLQTYDGKDFKTVMNETATGKIHIPIFYYNGEEKELIGYNLSSSSGVGGEIYLLDSDKFIEYEDVNLVNADVALSMEDPFVVFDEKYVVVVNDDDKAKYGVMDITTGKMVIGLEYDRLYPTHTDNYIAIKNGKTGVINRSLKKMVNFEYDFIDINDGFYVVGQDDKLAIMNDKFDFVTGFDFEHKNTDLHPYVYLPCCANFNTFEAYKVKDKYVLINNIGDDSGKASSAYVISENGKYEEISQNTMKNNGEFIYSYLLDDKKITIYDEELKEMYSLSFKEYDIDEDDDVFVLLNKDILIVNINETELYYDYKTGEEIKDPVVTYEINNVKMTVDLESMKINFYEDDKAVNLDIDIDNTSRIIELNDGRFVVYSNENLILVKENS